MEYHLPPMSKQEKKQLTPEGFEELKKELEYRRSVKKKEISNLLNSATEKGDLSENDEYSIALEENLANEARISELVDIIKNAEVIKVKKGSKTIDVGKEVKLKDKQGKEKIIKIVGETEGDPMNNKISNISPMGKELIGKKEGDTVEIDTPSRKKEYTIKEVK